MCGSCVENVSTTCGQHAGINQQWGLSNELFVLGDSLVLTVLGQVSFMPVLVLAARLCPEVKHHLDTIHICLHSLQWFCHLTVLLSVQYASCFGLHHRYTMLSAHFLCAGCIRSSRKQRRRDSKFDAVAALIISLLYRELRPRCLLR